MHVEDMVAADLLLEFLSKLNNILGLANEPIKRLTFVTRLLCCFFPPVTTFSLVDDEVRFREAINLPERRLFRTHFDYYNSGICI